MEMIALVLVILGIGLLIAEIFIPSFGITGTVGIISILIGVILTAETFVQGLVMFLGIMAVALVLMYLFYKLILSKKSPVVLKSVVNEEEMKSDLHFFVNKQGVALTTLRPTGKGDFDGIKLDVLSEGSFIKKGSPIMVTKIEGKKIIVDTLSLEGEYHDK